MTVEVSSADGDVAATVENGTADDSFAVALAEHGVGTEAVAFGNLSATLDADANGTLVASANESSPLATDAGTAGFDPVAYLAVDGNLSDDAVANATVEFVADDRLDADAVAVRANRGDGWERVATTESGVARNGTAKRVTTSGPAVFAVGVHSPSLAVTEVATANSTVEAGDAVAVTATVRNRGTAAGTSTATLLVDGDARNETAVTVPANDTATVTFRPQFESSGNHTLTVGGATATVTVESADDGDETTTATSTAEPTTPTTDPATTTEGDAEEASTTGQPGFGPVAVLVALLGAGLLALRRGT
jgi:PGF-CTERM protein